MKKNSATHKLTAGELMLAFGIILHQLFHLTGDVTFAAVSKKGERISRAKGVAPILETVKAEPDFLKGAVVADRVIGKAAAMLLYKYGVSEIYTFVASEYAVEYLSDKSIDFTYDNTVSFIVNRDGTDMCPIEKAVLSTDDADEDERLIREKIKAMKG